MSDIFVYTDPNGNEKEYSIDITSMELTSVFQAIKVNNNSSVEVSVKYFSLVTGQIVSSIVSPNANSTITAGVIYICPAYSDKKIKCNGQYYFKPSNDAYSLKPKNQTNSLSHVYFTLIGPIFKKQSSDYAAEVYITDE